MSCNEPIAIVKTAPTYGVNNPRYYRPLVRIGGMVQDMPMGGVINACYIDIASVAEKVIATLPPTTPEVSVSTSEPTPVIGVSIPSDEVGQGVYVLTKPDAWGQVTLEGTTYNFPLYAQIP